MSALIISAFMLPAYSLYAQNEFHEIDYFLQGQMQAWHIPNISIAITNSDSVLYQKEFGDDKSKGNYLIGSISKTFTAIAVMQLVEQGEINLDDPVKNYLSWFETKNNKVADRITVRHLLNQTSGLPKNAGFFTPKSTDQTEIERQYKNFLFSITTDESAIGKEHIYCNLNYQLLGQLIQKVSGLKYADYLNKQIFEPCNMGNTFASYQEAQSFGLKNGYQYLFGYPVKRSFVYNNNGIAAGDIASNTEDLSKLLQVLLRNGRIGSDSLLSKNSLRVMETPFSNRYGMGFSIGDWNGLHSVRHTGLTRNYSSAINILPNQNYGIVILTNINSFYAVRNLMDGVIIRLNQQDKIDYIPYEIYFRYVIFSLFLWTLIQFLLRLNTWRKQRFKVAFSKGRKDVFWIFVSVTLALGWLFIVPYLAGMPLLALSSLQPDLGYGLYVAVFITLLSGLVHYFIKSQQHAD